MKKVLGLLCVLTVCGLAVSAFAQADLDAFPIGTTKMVYNIRSEDMGQAQPLELSVVSQGNGLYTVKMSTEATGTKDQLAAFGFIFGATHVSAGSGQNVSYSSLQALMDQRSRLQEGQQYLLPGGGSFANIAGVTMAGVWCLQGTLVDPSEPNTRTTVAFALSAPVYISPLIRVEELRSGQWVETFSLVLVEYTVTGS